MKAVRVRGPGQIELADVPEPAENHEVLVKVRQVGICGTDTKILAGKIPVAYPRTLGHEVVGEVVSAGSAARFSAGETVIVDPGVSCGWCHACLAGKPNICINGGLLGRDVDGVFTEYITVPQDRLVVVPGAISLQAAGLLQVLGTAVHAVRSVNPFPGDVGLVVGLGVGGQLIAQLLTLRGMNVIGVTRSEWKRQLATELGAAWVSDPDHATELSQDVTNGRGPSLVVEAVGTEATLSDAIMLAGTGGEVLVYGTITGGSGGLPYYELYHKELTLYNPRAALLGDYVDGVALAAAGALRLEPIVTHQLALHEAERAFDLVQDSSSLKVLMTVS